MTDPAIVDETDPEDAFTALADETRVAILQALWDPQPDWSPDEPVPFSALREAVGMRDSGQFNYHLDKLTDRFVRKTDEGYQLTLAGRQVVGAIQSGSYTMTGSVDPITLDSGCPTCGDELSFTYEHELVSIGCRGCNHTVQFWIPAGVFEGVAREDFPRVASQYLRASVRKMQSGFCWFCEGPMSPDLVRVGSLVPPQTEEVALPEDLPMVRYQCDRCGESITTDMGTALLDAPEVAAFYQDHGIEVAEPYWWHATIVDTEDAHFADEDNSRACVTFHAGDETLELVVDEDLHVREAGRSRS